MRSFEASKFSNEMRAPCKPVWKGVTADAYTSVVQQRASDRSDETHSHLGVLLAIPLSFLSLSSDIVLWFHQQHRLCYQKRRGGDWLRSTIDSTVEEVVVSFQDQKHRITCYFCRKRREQAEDRREDHKPKFIQPQKEPFFAQSRNMVISHGFRSWCFMGSHGDVSWDFMSYDEVNHKSW